jgi:diguanylate cyclase (GGDEF)-like protein
VYKAVRDPSGGRPVGVVELYEDYAPIAATARSAWVRSALVLLSVLALLLVGLIPLLRRVSRQLSAQLVSIRHQALHDGLTGLPNRELFAEQVEQALREQDPAADGPAVLLVDLDHFKEVNDTLGHHSGDNVLREVAVRLTRLVRTADTVARLGGDEFGIVAPETGSTDALGLAQRVREGLQRPLHLDGLELEVDGSIGIALAPADGTDAGTLLRHADVALYEAKDLHQPTLYSADRDHYSPTRLALIGELRRAVARDELVLHYQPLAEMGSGNVACVELVRWQHPKLGLLPPDRFLPLAEHMDPSGTSRAGSSTARSASSRPGGRTASICPSP